MDSELRSPFLKLYGPLILTIVLIVAMFHTPVGGKDIPILLRPLGEFVDVHMEVTRLFTVRIVLIIAMLVSLSSYLIYDYSKMFPQHVKFDVFYDKEGIDVSFACIPPDSLVGLSIPVDAESRRQYWMTFLDGELQKATSVIDPFFACPGGSIHGRGEAEFEMKKDSGFQKYHIKISEGSYKTEMHHPGKPLRLVYAKFEIIPSSHDHIALSFKDFFVRRGTVLRTLYSQSLFQSDPNLNLLPRLTVVGLTPITIFPWPRVGHTVYMGLGDEDLAIPFGYATYY